MNENLIERLKTWPYRPAGEDPLASFYVGGLMAEAAAEIERLQHLYDVASDKRRTSERVLEDEIEALKDENEKLVSKLKTAVWTDSEYCKLLEAELTRMRDGVTRTSAELRHAYGHLVNGRVMDLPRLANGLIAPQIERLETIVQPAEAE